MIRYEFVDGASSKFWQYELRDTELLVEYGRIGAKAQTSTKSFDTEDDARRTADKLVKEKTGKGYRLVGGDTVAPTATPPPTAKATPEARTAKASLSDTPPAGAPPAAAWGLPEWLTQAQLDELVAKLGKKSKRSPCDLVEAAVGTDDVGTWGRRTDRANATIAIMVDRGLWPDTLLGDVLSNAIFGWAFMRPETLLRLIRHPDFEESRAEMALMRLGTADPALLTVERDADLPPKVARLAPLVRRRLRLSQEPLSDELADHLASAALRGSGSLGGQIERHGRCLADRYFSTYADYREYIVETFGIKDWDKRISVLAEKEGYGTAWRIEPSFLEAPINELHEYLGGADEIDGALLMRWLELRKDDPNDLVKVAKALKPGKPIRGQRHAYQIREAVAVVAGARLAAAGKTLPTELDECLWFLDNLPPTMLNVAYSRALAAWPKERVHARVRQLIKPPKEPKNIDSSDELPLAAPARVAVGLGAHPDGALTQQLLDGLTWTHLGEVAACVGRLGLEHLPELLARRERAPDRSQHWHLAIQTMLVNAAEQSGGAFAAEHDVHFDPRKCHNKTAWEGAVRLLPQERRDAYFLAWAKLDPFEHQPLLHLASDEALDQIVGLMFSLRKTESVYVTYPKRVSFDAVSRGLAACGPRVVPMIRKHYRASGGDAKAGELLAVMPIQPEEYAELVGGSVAAPVSAPELDDDTARRLTERVSKLAKQTTIKVISGTLLVATSGHAKPHEVRRTAPRGQAEVLTHYDDEVEGSTAGLDALCLRFDRGTIARWEEVPEALESDSVGLVLGDEDAFDRLTDEDRDALDELIARNVAHGNAVAVHKQTLVAAYVGEEAIEHRVFWGLDAKGRPACLLAIFNY